MNRYKLIKAGIDVNQGIRRFNNNKDLYENFLLSFNDDVNYEKLLEALRKSDVEEAFQTSHALKGLAGNLSLVQLHADLIPLVELLRARTLDGYEELLENVKKSYDIAYKAIEEAKTSKDE